MIEIVQHVALNTWTNYFNEVFKTDIDFPSRSGPQGCLTFERDPSAGARTVPVVFTFPKQQGCPTDDLQVLPARGCLQRRWSAAAMSFMS